MGFCSLFAIRKLLFAIYITKNISYNNAIMMITLKTDLEKGELKCLELELSELAIWARFILQIFARGR